MRQYPQLEIDLSLLQSNARAVISRCNAAGICVCGVIKGADGLPEIARTLRAAGAAELGTSRLEQVAKCRAAGVPGPWLLIRIPGLTELPDVVALCDTSLQSEWATLMALEEECLRQNRTHRVIVMTDLGDLREGFWDKDELVDVCQRVEQDLPHVHLAGIGVNLSCYGSTKPTPDKLNALVALAHRVEARIGRSLEVVSGGATSSFTLVHWGTMPAGINHLRIGEGTLLGKETEGNTLGEYCDKIYNRTNEIAASVKKVNLLYCLGDKGENVIAKGSYHAEIIDLLSNNLAVVESPSSKGTGNEVDIEQILKWNPDVILFAPGSVYATVGEDPAWQGVNAIKNGTYYEVPIGPYNWMGFPPSVQRMLGMMWMAKLLYPETADYDLQAEVTEYFKLFYHTTLSEDAYNALVANSIGTVEVKAAA